MKKNFVRILLPCVAIGFVICALSGCNKNKQKKLNEPLTKENLCVGFVYIGSINDQGYTQAQDQGRLALEAEGIKTRYVENVSEDEGCEKAIRDLIEQDCNVIYTTSYGFMDSTIKVAQEFPYIKFGHCSGYKRAANVSTYFGRAYEARYLAGIVAGMKTKSKKIGYVAAFPIPECIRGINAFALGVQSVKPDATVEVVWTNTWFDPNLERQAALELLEKGCDVLEQHQDSTVSQITAQSKGAFAIGYNVDTPEAAPKAYLTAPVFNWSIFIVDDVHKILDGSWKSRAYWEGLAAGMTDLAPLSPLCAPGTQEKVDEARAGIVNGSLKIFKGPIYNQSGELKIADGFRMNDEDIWNMDWFVKGVIGKI